MKFTRVFSCLLVSGVLLGGCSSAEKVDTSTPDGAFQVAEEYAKDERFEEAIQKFAEVKNKHPYSRFATQAELRIADLHFQREAYPEAQAAYQLFKDFHPKHQNVDYVTFRLAESYFKQLPSTIDRDLSLADKSILYYDEVINSYPQSAHFAEAKQKRERLLQMLAEKEIYIGDYYFKRDMYDSALNRYENLLKSYPDLGFDALALYRAATCAFEVGEKERGQQHLKRLYSQFPQSAEAQRARSELRQHGTN